MKKDNLLISFSGGRTSAYMLYWIINNPEYKKKYHFKVVFANTGKEHEKTLKFVRDCQENFGIEIVWIESKHLNDKGQTFSKKGWKVDFKIVDFESASRNGEPFEEMISVLGIPCSEAPFCSDQLKRVPIEKYLKSIGWDDYYKAIGIRCDEIDRVNSKWREKKIIYPLVKDHPVTKKQILKWWRNNHFDLDIHPNLGNCDLCWKKTMKVLVQNAKDFPDRFDWWDEMTKKYSNKETGRKKIDSKKISFYREGKTIQDIFELARLSSKQLELFTKDEKLDGCSDSCEVYK